MALKFKYRGRSFSSARSMFRAMQSDAKRDHEKAIRKAAAGTGLSVRKSGNDLKLSGTADQFDRLNRRLK